MAKPKVYDYPLQYDQHMIHVPQMRKPPVLDENYPYRDLSAKGKFNRGFTYFITKFIAFPLIGLLTGLKVNGREKIKQNKELLKNGAITICNHVHMWDMVCVLKATRPYKSFHPGWAGNMPGPNAKLIRGVGGMPVPVSSKGLKKFSDTMDQIVEEGTWMHFFPEGSMWFFYDAIRPFKKGAFALAVKHNKPIVPCCINFRPAKGIRKIFTKGQPFLTINVGDPILPDLSKPKSEAIWDLLISCRTEMQRLGGFETIIPQEATERPTESD